MRRALLCLLLAGLLCLVSQAAFAADTATITVTVTLQNIGVTVDPTSWPLGVVAPSSSSTSSFTAENTGNVNEDLTITTGNTTPSGWQPAAASAVDYYRLELGLGETPTWTDIVPPPDPLASTLAPGNTVDFDLRFTAPAPLSTFNADGETFTVTIAATAS